MWFIPNLHILNSDAGLAEEEEEWNERDAVLDTGGTDDQNLLGVQFIPSCLKSLCRKILALVS